MGLGWEGFANSTEEAESGSAECSCAPYYLMDPRPPARRMRSVLPYTMCQQCQRPLQG